MPNTTSQLSMWKKIDRFLQQWGCPDNPSSNKPLLKTSLARLATVKGINSLIPSSLKTPSQRAFHAQLANILTDADAVNYQGFRYHVDKIDQPEIRSVAGFTLIFDTQKCLRAVIQAANIDTRNQCHSAHYFVIARSNQTQQAGKKLNAKLTVTLAFEKILDDSLQSIVKVSHRLKQGSPTPIAPREAKIVWTTLRLSR